MINIQSKETQEFNKLLVQSGIEFTLWVNHYQKSVGFYIPLDDGGHVDVVPYTTLSNHGDELVQMGFSVEITIDGTDDYKEVSSAEDVMELIMNAKRMP